MGSIGRRIVAYLQWLFAPADESQAESRPAQSSLDWLLGSGVLVGSFAGCSRRKCVRSTAPRQPGAARWSVVLGGQIFAKSLRGSREGDVPGLLEKEGIVMAVLIFLSPLVFIALFNRVLPVFEHRTSKIVPAPRTGLADRVSAVPSPVWFRRRGTRRFLERVRGPGLRLRHAGEEN